MQPRVIFADEYFLVIDKPAGMVVNRAETTRGEETVEDWLRQNFQFSIFNFQLLRSGIVHRLDKETSGLLLIAKTPEAFANLQAQFKNRQVQKKYLALVHGKVLPDEGEIKAPVGRLPWNRERFGVVPGGREAVTKYKVIKYFATGAHKFSLRFRESIGQNISTQKDSGNHKDSRNQRQQEFTFLQLYPQTGRTHQIRVHLKYLGYPIVGDIFYGGRKQGREDRKFCPRVFLHASFLQFSHPVTGEAIKFESPLPDDLNQIIRFLETSL